MTSFRVLLVQVRDDGDPMARHEAECVTRRLAPSPVVLDTRNALVNRSDASWLDGHDAVIIGGSGDYSVHDPRSRQWVDGLHRLLDGALERKVPTFGLCFGHQLLGKHLGAEVATDEAYAELGTVDLELTPEGLEDPVFSGLEPEYHGHTGHSDHVTRVPDGVRLLSRNARLATQAFKVDGAPVYSTQYHPDMTAVEALSRYLAYRNALPDEIDPATGETTRRFRPGADAATMLLGRFVEAARRGTL